MTIIQPHANSTCIIFLFFYISFQDSLPLQPQAKRWWIVHMLWAISCKKRWSQAYELSRLQLRLRVGSLFLEMEHCPFVHCANTFIDPESNISHQEEVHRSVKTWMCTVCEINFVSEGCVTRHMLSFHRGPMGYAEDLKKVHEDSRLFSFST